jgi:hypothetical protein
MLTVARIAKGAVGVRSGFTGYAGDEISENVIRFEKGPNNKIFIRNVIYRKWDEILSPVCTGMFSIQICSR